MTKLTEADCLTDEFSAGDNRIVHFNISFLNLDGIEIKTIENNSLCNFPKLSFFKANVDAYSVEEIFQSGIKTVQSISFANSLLPYFDICLYATHFKVEELQLSANYIKEIETSNGSCSSLRILDLSYNKINEVSFSQVKHIKRVIDMNLSNNQISSVTFCPNNSSTIKMELVNLNLSFNVLSSLNQGQFSCLQNLKVLTLNDNRIVKIKRGTFHNLGRLEVLILENNQLYKIGEYDFQNLSSLKQLNLNENSLTSVNDWAFLDLKQIEEITLTFSDNVKDMWWSKYIAKTLRKITLKTYDTFIWLLFQHFKDFFFLEILEIEAKKNCGTEIDFTLFLVTFVSILMFMFISLFHESIWWYTLYIFYRIRCWLIHKRNTQVRGQYDYDVFVSYNTHDEPWVTGQLLPNLENKGPPFIRVCIHNRDFEVGKDIVDNIVDSIYKSKCTICLITRSYLQSHWCSLELRISTYRLVAENKDSLIIIFLDNISREELQLYHRLTKLLDTKTYLNWPDDVNAQQVFWERLRKVICTDVERDQL
ncbi:uncharacterized protein O3C94_017964 [Discoglossus pictus]